MDDGVFCSSGLTDNLVSKLYYGAESNFVPLILMHNLLELFISSE